MKKTRSKGYSFRQLYLHIVPLVVWLGAVACVFILFKQRAQRFQVVGMARGQIRQVAANCAGRIIDIPVELHDRVEKGQVVAIVDTVLDNERRPQLIEAQVATVQAEVKRLEAELEYTRDVLLTEQAERESDRVAEQRRFDVDIESTKLQILSTRAQLAADRMTLADLKTEAEALRELVESDAIAPYELERVQAQYIALAEKIKQNEKLLEEAQAALEANIARREAYTDLPTRHTSVDRAIDVIRKEILVQKKLMDEYMAVGQRQPVELKAPISGIIVAVGNNTNQSLSRRPGENVMKGAQEVLTAGEPILAIAEETPNEIVAYLSQNQLGGLEENKAVQLIKNRAPRQLAETRIASIGATMELMPERLWRNPTAPQWGMPITVNIPPGLDIEPGELIGIRGF